MRLGWHGAAVVLAAAWFGCEADSFVEPVPPAACTEIGARCQLPEGPLGVCIAGPCAPDATPPCFVCTPQH